MSMASWPMPRRRTIDEPDSASPARKGVSVTMMTRRGSGLDSTPRSSTSQRLYALKPAFGLSFAYETTSLSPMDKELGNGQSAASRGATGEKAFDVAILG